MSQPDTITIYSDYVCPFCYLGHESLARYQATREEPLDLDWHPFDLRSQQRRPDGTIDHAADDGKDEAYYEQAKENVRRLQEKYDVEMDLEIATDIDSLPAQVASYAVAREHPRQWRAFDRAIFDALWQDGRDIGDTDVLADLATDVGLEESFVRQTVDDAAIREAVFAEFEAARRAGVTGVPTFAYEGHAARGAVPPEQLRRLVEGV